MIGRLVAVVVAICLLATGCSTVATSDAVGGRGPASGMKPTPGVEGLAEEDVVTSTKFSGEVSFEKKDQVGVNAIITNKRDAGGFAGFDVEFHGPKQYKAPSGRTYGEEFGMRTGHDISYQGNGGYSAGPQTKFTDADLASVTGYVCGDLVTSSRNKIQDFCIARYNGSSFWWTYFGANTMFWQDIEQVAYSPANYVGSEALCQVVPTNVCVGVDQVGTVIPYSPNVNPIAVWAMSCTGGRISELSIGCLVAEQQARITSTIYKPDGECVGALGRSRECALINIVPTVESITSGKDGAYEVAKNPGKWSNPKVCGDATWTPAASSAAWGTAVVKSWRGFRDRNNVVLLRSATDGNAEIRGILTQRVSPHGACGVPSEEVSVDYDVYWSPKVTNSPYVLPRQDCKSTSFRGVETACVIGSSATLFRDKDAANAAEALLIDSSYKFVYKTFLTMMETFFGFEPFAGGVEGAFAAAAALVLAYFDYLKSTYAYQFTTVFVGEKAA